LNDPSETLTIDGPGASLLSIAGGSSGVFTVDSGTTAIMQGLKVTDGHASNGAGIDNSGTLTVEDSTITGNTANDGGGGIYNNDGTLNVIDSTLSGNTSGTTGSGKAGGGIYSYGGTASVSYSTISNNIAGTGSNRGYGGGLANWNGGTFTVTNCTLTGNTAYRGGGIDSDSGTFKVYDSTLYGNSAHSSSGGGIYNNGGGGSNATLTGVIVAGSGSIGGDLAGDGFSGTYNLIDDTTGHPNGLSNASGAHNLFDESADLAPLGYYGGPTQTMALEYDSPAIGKGVVIGGITKDQRGQARPDSEPDIGAFQTVYPMYVNTNQDVLIVPSGVLTLRDALNVANASGGTQVIKFADGLSGETINLSGSPLLLDDTTPLHTLTIYGQVLGVNVKINAGNFSQVFIVDSGCSASLQNLVITGGYTTGNGGGIENNGNLNVYHSTISGNTASKGGGIFTAQGATLYTYQTTLTDNTASHGGGIYNNGDSITVSHSTITGNTATTTGGGGGIYDNNVGYTSKSYLFDSTVTGNTNGNEEGGRFY
jgi:hypothetical protein